MYGDGRTFEDDYPFRARDCRKAMRYDEACRLPGPEDLLNSIVYLPMGE